MRMATMMVFGEECAHPCADDLCFLTLVSIHICLYVDVVQSICNTMIRHIESRTFPMMLRDPNNERTFRAKIVPSYLCVNAHTTGCETHFRIIRPFCRHSMIKIPAALQLDSARWFDACVLVCETIRFFFIEYKKDEPSSRLRVFVLRLEVYNVLAEQCAVCDAYPIFT